MDRRDNSGFPRQQSLLRAPEVCIYCGAPADTRDHVPPRLLLEEPLPPNLLTVPACWKCNNGCSDDERYVRDALHLVGFGEISREKTAPGGVVARSLEHFPIARPEDEPGSCRWRGWAHPFPAGAGSVLADHGEDRCRTLVWPVPSLRDSFRLQV